MYTDTYICVHTYTYMQYIQHCLVTSRSPCYNCHASVYHSSQENSFHEAQSFF